MDWGMESRLKGTGCCVLLLVGRGLRGAGTPLALVHIRSHNLDEHPGTWRSRAVSSAGKPLISEAPSGITWERCLRVPDSAAVAVHAHFLEILPRRAGSHPRSCAWVRSFPHALLARQMRGSAGERPAWGDLTPPLTGKTQEQAGRSALPGNPIPRALREGPAGLPGGGSEVRLRRTDAEERRTPGSEARPGNPAPQSWGGVFGNQTGTFDLRCTRSPWLKEDSRSFRIKDASHLSPYGSVSLHLAPRAGPAPRPPLRPRPAPLPL